MLSGRFEGYTRISTVVQQQRVSESCFAVFPTHILPLSEDVSQILTT